MTFSINIGGSQPGGSGGGGSGGTTTQSADIAGGAAGDHTVTGIEPADELLLVLFINGSGASDNITAEFTITATNTINNGGGSDTTGGTLTVMWGVAGSGGGNLSGTLTSGTLPKATGAHTLADSNVTDDGSGPTVTIAAGQIAVALAFQKLLGFNLPLY